MACICSSGILFTLAMKYDLLSASIKFQSDSQPMQVLVKRDEHFKRERKIVIFYALLFLAHSLNNILIILESRHIFINNECDQTCEVLRIINFGFSAVILVIYTIAIVRLINVAR